MRYVLKQNVEKCKVLKYSMKGSKDLKGQFKVVKEWHRGAVIYREKFYDRFGQCFALLFLLLVITQ